MVALCRQTDGVVVILFERAGKLALDKCDVERVFLFGVLAALLGDGLNIA